MIDIIIETFPLFQRLVGLSTAPIRVGGLSSLSLASSINRNQNLPSLCMHDVKVGKGVNIHSC